MVLAVVDPLTLPASSAHPTAMVLGSLAVDCAIQWAAMAVLCAQVSSRRIALSSIFAVGCFHIARHLTLNAPFGAQLVGVDGAPAPWILLDVLAHIAVPVAATATLLALLFLARRPVPAASAGAPFNRRHLVLSVLSPLIFGAVPVVEGVVIQRRCDIRRHQWQTKSMVTSARLAVSTGTARGPAPASTKNARLGARGQPGAMSVATVAHQRPAPNAASA